MGIASRGRVCALLLNVNRCRFSGSRKTSQPTNDLLELLPGMSMEVFIFLSQYQSVQRRERER